MRITFDKGDLFFSITNSTILLNGEKGKDGKWNINCKLKDTYDFTKSFILEKIFKLKADEIGIGEIANDVAAISQTKKFITPFDIEVEFNITR